MLTEDAREIIEFGCQYLFLTGTLITFQAVVSEVQRLNTAHNLFIKTLVGRLQVIFNGA